MFTIFCNTLFPLLIFQSFLCLYPKTKEKDLFKNKKVSLKNVLFVVEKKGVGVPWNVFFR